MRPPWIFTYGGRQWSPDFNCWDLVKLILKEELGLDATTPFDNIADALDASSVSNAITHVERLDVWRQINDPREFDICVMGKKDIVHHIGLVTPNTDYVFHMEPGKL